MKDLDIERFERCIEGLKVEDEHVNRYESVHPI
jgi:hypothetical protein